MKREKGFYWLQDRHGIWTIAEYVGDGKWHFMGSPYVEWEPKIVTEFKEGPYLGAEPEGE